MTEKKIICFSGIIEFAKVSLTKTKNNLYSVKIRLSDNRYIINGAQTQIEHNYVWATIFADKNKEVCDKLGSDSVKGSFILIKDCKISRFESKGNSEEKFGITTSTNHVVVSNKPMQAVNCAVIQSKLNHSLKDKPFVIDGKASSLMVGESFEIPIVYDDDGFRPQQGYNLVIGKISGKTISQTQIPHIVTHKIVPC